MVENPTVVVGVGEAGCKMAADLYRDIDSSEEEIIDDFKFIGIDTKGNDLKNHTTDGFRRIPLESQPNYFDRNREEFGYLRSDMHLDPRGGASRQRAASRYYIDNTPNFDRFWAELEDEIQSFAERNPRTNLWIVNSLGGGTGSGSFPLLSAMIKEMTDNIRESQFWIGGIGSLPRLDALDESDKVPDDDAVLYANAYAALRELAVLLDYDFADDTASGYDFTRAAGESYPLEVRVEAESSTISRDALTLSEPPFDFYGLMGLYEGKSESYQREMNRIAVNTILYFARETGLEDFGRGLLKNRDVPTLYSLDSTGVDVPVDVLDDYLDLENTLSDRRAERKAVLRDVNRLAASRDVISTALDRHAGESLPDVHPVRMNRFDPTDGSIVEDPLGRDSNRSLGIDHGLGWDQITDIHGTATAKAAEFSLSVYSAEILEQEEEELLNHRETLPEDYAFDGDDLVRYFYYQDLVDRFTQELRDHPFNREMSEELEAREEFIKQNVDVDVSDLSEQSASEKWEQAVREVYDTKLTGIDRLLDRTPRYKFRKRGELEDRKEELKGRKTELQKEYEAYLTLENGLEDAKRRLERAETNLNSARSDVNTELDRLEDDRETVENRIEQIEEQMASKRDRLENRKVERFMSLPFADFQKVTQSTLDSADGILDLGVSQGAGLVRDEDVVESIGTLIDELEEPIEDGDVEVERPVPTILAGLANAQNRRILDGELDDQVRGDGISSKYQRFDQHNTPQFDRRFSIRLVGLWTNVALENTSEFGVMHRKYKSDAQVADEFNYGRDDDEFVTSSFAYPELFPEDEAITSYFGK